MAIFSPLVIIRNPGSTIDRYYQCVPLLKPAIFLDLISKDATKSELRYLLVTVVTAVPIGYSSS